MKTLPELFQRNRAWAERQKAAQPDFFQRLVAQQAPSYLWIGCSDSRVPANEIVDLLPGELFVHRNIANVVVHTDLNCLSVLQYAIEILGVRHIIVCGHYGCGGVRAALEKMKVGLADNWLRHVVDVRTRHAGIVDAAPDQPEALKRLCELNVLEQALHVCETTTVQDAWAQGKQLIVHSWIYGIEDGHLRDLGFHVTSHDEVAPTYARTIAAVGG